MADEEVTKWHSDPWAVLIFFILIAALMNALLNFVQDRFNFSGDIGSLSGVISGELNETSPLGTRVYSKEDVEVRGAPGDGVILGTQGEDSNGVTTDGPVLIGDERWWYVDYQEDPDGWVAESALGIPRVSTVLGPNTPLGTNVRSIVSSELLSNPGFGSLAGFLPSGVIGSLTDGPSLVDGVRWWKVAFDNGAEGWLTESSLELATIGGIVGFAKSFWFWFSVVSYTISAILAVIVAVLILRINKIRYDEIQAIWASLPQKGRTLRNERWEQVLELVGSDRPAEWRQAIIEADIMLDDLITNQMMMRGETMGDRLKQIEKSDFNTLDFAVEAHRVRNRIAHQGSDYILTQREARRVIELYRAVFNEFGMV